jgi:hypothetical protein
MHQDTWTGVSSPAGVTDQPGPNKFLRKSNSTFSWSICLESSYFLVSDWLKNLLAAVAEDVRQTGQRLFLTALRPESGGLRTSARSGPLSCEP